MSILKNRRRGVGKKSNPYLMTSETNPEVLAICYAQGWCASPDYMTYEEAAMVTDIGTVFRSKNIVNFDEFRHFGVQALPTNAFNSCTKLKSVTCGVNVSSINSNAFTWCTKLERLKVLATTPPILGNNVFTNTNDTFLIFVPSQSESLYKTASDWSTLADRIFAIPT